MLLLIAVVCCIKVLVQMFLGMIVSGAVVFEAYVALCGFFCVCVSFCTHQRKLIVGDGHGPGQTERLQTLRAGLGLEHLRL